MKTLKIITAISLALILAAANSLFAGRNMINDPQTNDWARLITYVVQVDNSQHFTGTDGRYHVVITDGSGRLVAPAQLFRAGVWEYRFKEIGNVRGTRIARMIKENDPSGSGSWTINPVQLYGFFIGGQTYKFKLVPHKSAISIGKAEE